jgi:tRNA_anti-like
MKKIITAVVVLGVIGAGIGYYMYNKPVASLENKKPDVEVSAAKLITDYEADEKTANDTYLGKVVQVNGKIANITSDEGKMKIHLETENPISMVIAEMEDSSRTGSLKTGDEIRLKGMCSGYLSDVILVQSSIVK